MSTDRHLPGMEPLPDPEPPKPKPRAKRTDAHQQVIDAFDLLYREAYDSGPTWNVSVTALAKHLLKDHELPLILERMRRYFADPPEFMARTGHALDFRGFVRTFDMLAEPRRKKGPPPERWQDKAERWKREKEEEERNG